MDSSMDSNMDSSLPPLPKIEDDIDLMLDVHTHRSLRNPRARMAGDYGDAERLAELGAQVVNLVTTYHLFAHKPMLSQVEIQERRAEENSAYKINIWLDQYDLKRKICIHPDQEELLNDPEEMQKFFYTYVGAIYLRSGLQAVQTWISSLIDPHSDVTVPGPNTISQPPLSPPSYQTQHSGFQQSALFNTHPAPPSGAPPPLPTSPPPAMSAGGPNPDSLSLVTLALVNQTAAQRGLSVSYPAEQQGQAHAPTWTVKCLVNGVEKGYGQGKSQKIAKEAAARQAWVAMGWGPSY